VETPPVDVSTLRELYTTPPAQFVAARNELVKERRTAKDRDAAAALGKLRKPSLAEWALNSVVSTHGDEVAAFLEAAGTVRDAQAAAIEGRKGPDVRGALRDLREHSGQVLARAQEVLAGAGRDAAAEAGTVASRLTEVSASADASAQLGAGVLGSAVVLPADVFGELKSTARPTKRQAAKRSVSTKEPSAAASVTQTRERERAQREARRGRDAAAKALARAEAAVEKAAAAVRNAERQLDQTQRALAAAESERDDTARRLAEADEALRQTERT
jgi:hypothetical protein